jgi:predicted nucleic acid-binding protein
VSGYVIDASVAIKWVIDEPGSEQALKLRRHAVAAPDLLISECANIVWKKVRLGELTGPEATMAIRLLVRADIELVPARQLASRAVEWAILLDHSAYDCMYLTLAEATTRPFVTADARLLRKLAAERTAARSVAAVALAEFGA